MAIFNKYICEVCRPIFDIIRGSPPANSESLAIEQLSNEPDGARIALHRNRGVNKQSLQDSAEEGCYVCRVAVAHLLYQRRQWGYVYNHAAFHHVTCSFLEDDEKLITRFYWCMRYTLEVRLRSPSA